ncbi:MULTISPECIES: hypothetical protein [unclassified Nocardia]|uniref:hypothetical protein n=1 Tax=unclassified Nocardia TaxID=2637762 RepID=UPI001CE471FD|nr:MULTISPECIES: hypothetical protein [unclassified Nocardia]
MGFIIWYKLEFRTDPADAAPLLRLSNDVLQSAILLDAAVTTSAKLGPNATEFDITLWDLPQDSATGLAEQSRRAAGSKKPLLVDISLGYFDEPTTQQAPMLRGAITEVRTEVAADGSLLTKIRGRELASYLLLSQPFSFDRAGEVDIEEILRKITKDTGVEIGHEGVAGTVRDRTISNGKALTALGVIAVDRKVPLAVRAQKAVLGTVSDPAPPARFTTAAANVVSKRRWDSGSPDPQAGPGSTTRYELTVLGDPTLQIGAKAILDGLETHDLRIESVKHLFSMRGGYTCEVTVLEAEAAARPEAADGPQAVFDGFASFTRGLLADHPSVDVGDIAEYRKSGDGDNGGHRATLHYGQQRAASSVDDPVDNRLLLHEKPMSSVFAWDKTGLMVPVYPGMRAVLVHNGGEVNDAVAAGFLWSRNANHQPPKNEVGDYWLCLPTQVSDGKPEGKGVNDLTDASGHRVVQAVGLGIEIGNGVLPDVGERPMPPTGETLTIKHGKGTTITIAEDGAVTIATDGAKASITLRGSEITMKADSIKLDATAVQVGS